ncbi:hypothetical protein [Vulcanisaeta distributa]|uniref:hypothetical protein n=1 Tax=Vulcanisaeta distributa TaxID=164451 RepID=UPI000B2F9389|nr:hypothetical protein [Vulcanisaeta distributa]
MLIIDKLTDPEFTTYIHPFIGSYAMETGVSTTSIFAMTEVLSITEMDAEPTVTI